MRKARVSRDLLRSWDLTRAELTEIVAENPSMRGLMFGYVAEYKLKKIWLERPEIENVMRPRAHDRKAKGDFRFQYRGRTATLEVKCLDIPKVRFKAGAYEGTFQCNASDARSVALPNGETLTTNCLVAGEFDLLAVCLFAFEKVWRFAFALNTDLPRTTWQGYTPAQQKHLLKSTMPISWPLRPPFEAEPFDLLDRLVAKRVRR